MPGRVFNKKNVGFLKTIKDNIESLLTQLADEEDGESDGEDTEKPTEESVTEAALVEVSLTEYAPLTSQG